MKTNIISLSVLAATLSAATLAFAQDRTDPTHPTGNMEDTLRSQIVEFRSLTLGALVVGADDKGIALFSSAGAGAGLSSFQVRSGSSVVQELGGIPVRLNVKSVTADGVEIEAPTLSEKLVIPSGLKSLPPTKTETIGSGALRYLECTKISLEQVLRLIADQTGANLSASKAAANEIVSIYLRNVTPDVAVEEICRARGLWFRRDDTSGIIRITTMSEYEQSLTSFREEQTKSFTLLYPNVIEVASVIYGLYPDRVMLTLGEEEILDDESNDISRRFERFNSIANSGGSSFLSMNPGTSSGGSSSGGSGVFSYNGGTVNKVGQDNGSQARQTFSGLTADGAKKLANLMQSGTNTAQTAVEAFQNKNASIFVTVSRRNNMIVLRTGDPQVMTDICDLIRRLDVPAPMVLLEVKILQISLNDDFNSTFEYAYAKNFTANGKTPVQTTAGFPGFTPLATDARTDALSFQLLSDHLAMRIQLMEEKGLVKTLATPTLLTANNEISRLFIGEERPFVKNVTSQTVVSDTATITTPQVELAFQDVGTMLLLTPNINADRTVTLRLLQENSKVVKNDATIPIYSSTDGSLVQDYPVDIVSSRSISGTFTAKDDMFVAVGGLIEESESEKVNRIPILGRLPLLGFLFRSTTKEKTRSELVVLIRPHVISTPAEGEDISRRLLDKLSVHPAKDGRASIGVLNSEKDMAVISGASQTNGLESANKNMEETGK